MKSKTVDNDCRLSIVLQENYKTTIIKHSKCFINNPSAIKKNTAVINEE